MRREQADGGADAEREDACDGRRERAADGVVPSASREENREVVGGQVVDEERLPARPTTLVRLRQTRRSLTIAVSLPIAAPWVSNGRAVVWR